MDVVGIVAAVGGFAIAWWIVGRVLDRPCPRCGKGVRRGRLDCPHCGFDFNAVGR